MNWKAEIVKKENSKVTGKAEFDKVRNGYVVSLSSEGEKDVFVFEEPDNVKDYNKNHVLEMLWVVFMDFFAEDMGKHAKARLKFCYQVGENTEEKERKVLEKELDYDLVV